MDDTYIGAFRKISPLTSFLSSFVQNATHPLFNLTVTHARGMMAHFYGQDRDKLPSPPRGARKMDPPRKK